MFDAQTKLSSEVVAELHGFIEQAQGKPLPWAGAKVFDTKIRRNIKLAECPSFGQTIMKYDAASNGAFDYRNLARELLGLAPIVPKPVPAKTQAAVAAASAPGAPTMPASTSNPTPTPASTLPSTPAPSVSVTVNPAIVTPPKPTTSRVAATPKVPKAVATKAPASKLPAAKAPSPAPAPVTASPVAPVPQQQEVA